MAYLFDGSGDYIEFTKGADATDLSVVSYVFTYYKDAFSGAYREIFWSGGAWSANFHTIVQHDASNYMAFVADWSGAQARWSVPNPSDTTWVTDVITYDFSSTANDPVWYRSGTSQTVTERVTPSGSSNHTVDDGTLTIGAGDGGGAEFWLGRIAQFGIYNRAVSAQEASILSQGYYPPSTVPSGLVFYSNFRNESTTEKDIISGNTGTVTAAVPTPHPNIIKGKNTPNNLRPYVFGPGIAR